MAAADLFVDLLKRAAINRGVASLQKRIGQYYSDSDDDNTNQFVSNQRQGLGSILGKTAAYGLLGPIFGPIAFALGKGIMNRRNRMNLTNNLIDDRGGVTATGMQFADVQDTLGSSDSGTDIDYNTGDITNVATGQNIGNVYDEVALTGGDSSSDDGSNGGGGGSTGSMDASDFSDDTAGTPFRYGGLASLYR